MKREVKVVKCSCDRCGSKGEYENNEPSGWARVAIYFTRDDGLATTHVDVCSDCRIGLAEWLKVDPNGKTRDEVDAENE